MMSDLTVLAALFGETYEATNQHQALTTFATALTNDADLRGDLKQIVNAEGYGSFWILPAVGEYPTMTLSQFTSNYCCERSATASCTSTGVTRTSPLSNIGMRSIGRRPGKTRRSTSLIGRRTTTWPT